jgi:hypothetical protein
MERSRRFAVYFGDGPIQDVTVVPYGWFWWAVGSSQPMIPHTDMDWAVVNWKTDQVEATERLNVVIQNYPNSDAARWASETLRRLREPGSRGAPGWTSEMVRRLQAEARKRRGQSAKGK